MRALLATDEILGNTTSLALAHGSFECRVASDPTAVRGMLTTWKPQIVMVDADRSPEAVHKLRLAIGQEKIGLIAFARKRRLSVKMGIFEAGADDLIEAPFTVDEIFGRPVAAARRLDLPRVEFVQTIKAGALDLDLGEERVRAGNVWLRLGIADLTLVYLFVANPDVVFTPDIVNEYLWGSDFTQQAEDVEDRLQFLHGSGRANAPRIIEAIAGAGYRLAA